MRLTFFLLVLANLLFFAWGQGYFGQQDEGREPQRLKDQLQADKIKLVVRDKAAGAAAAPAPACRMVDKLAAADAQELQKRIADTGGDMLASIEPIDDAASFWVNIPALANKAIADKKVGELKLLGVSDFHVMQSEGGFAISLGLFPSEAAANEFLQGLIKKGVKSARVEARPKSAALMRLQIRGPADRLTQRLPALLSGVVGASTVDCP